MLLDRAAAATAYSLAERRSALVGQNCLHLISLEVNNKRYEMDRQDHSNVKAASHLNFGILRLRMPPDGPQDSSTPITVIVTGVDQICTERTAVVVSALGIAMGLSEDAAVLDDKEFVASLRYCDFRLMRALVDRRNMESARWGFQFPLLQDHLLPLQLKHFRNPYLIVVTRDPTATVSHPGNSSQKPWGASALFSASQEYFDMARFVQKTCCPTLIISYDRILAVPEYAVDGIAAFCGQRINPAARDKALRAIARPE